MDVERVKVPGQEDDSKVTTSLLDARILADGFGYVWVGRVVREDDKL